MSENGQERTPIKWEDLKVFVDTETGQALRLQVGQGSGRPLYSVDIGRMRDEKFLRFHRVQYSVDVEGRVTAPPFCDMGTYDRLADECCEFVKATQEDREKAYAAKKAPRSDASPRGDTKKPRKRRGTHGKFEGDDGYRR